jgi:hypothetical protein
VRRPPGSIHPSTSAVKLSRNARAALAPSLPAEADHDATVKGLRVVLVAVEAIQEDLSPTPGG